MKALLIAVVAVTGMVLAGWLTFASSEDMVSVSVDTKEVKEDTKKAVEAGDRLIDNLTESAEDAAESVGSSIHEATANEPVEQDVRE